VLKIIPDEHGCLKEMLKCYEDLSAVRNREPNNYFSSACLTSAMSTLHKPASEPPHWSEAIKGVTPLVER
jgi:hypothetical protein